MIEQIYDFVTDPITSYTVVAVGYVLMFVLSIGMKYGWEQITGRTFGPQLPEDWSFRKKVAVATIGAPVGEELSCRWLPIYLGFSEQWVVGFTVLWIVGHGRFMVLVLPMGVLLLKMALGGLLIEIVLLHVFHNVVSVVWNVLAGEQL